MSYLGDIQAGSIIYTKFTTVGTTGAPTTLSGTPALSVYKDDSDSQSTSGITLTADADSVTGLNKVKIDTSSDGTFYAAGHDFQIVITTGTVGGTSVVGYVVGEFSISNRTQKADVTKVDGSALTSHSSGKLPADVLHIASSAVSTSTAQIGVNVVSFSSNGLKKNAAFTELPFVMLDDTTGDPAAGLTVSVQRLLVGGSFGVGGLNNVQDKGNGVYTVDGIGSDVNSAYVTFKATATGAKTTLFTLITVP